MSSLTPPGDVKVGSQDVERLAADLRLVIGRLARRLRQLADSDVTASSLSALWSVEQLGPVTLGDLAAAERVQPPTITRIVSPSRKVPTKTARYPNLWRSSSGVIQTRKMQDLGRS